jgi:predicted molibdopterin-dependent oxidoreductase YjgC
MTEAELAHLDVIVCLDILPNTATKLATAILPGTGFAEKRGSMVNAGSRIQRLNRATQPPGQARDDWEILSDLLRALGVDVPQTLDGIFKEMSAAVPAFSGLTLAKLGDGGIPLETAAAAQILTR